LPEHILEQMPDDLLDSKASAGVKRGRYADPEQESEGGEAAEIDEPEIDFEPAVGKRAPAQPFEEDLESDDSTLSEDLSESISAVEKVFNEFDRGGSSRKSSAYAISNRYAGESAPTIDEEEAEEVIPFAEAEKAPEYGSNQAAFHDEPVQMPEPESASPFVETPRIEVPEPESPFETVFDPITGVYRLKAKEPKTEEQNEGFTQGHDYDSRFEGASNLSEPESAFQRLETAKSLFQSSYRPEDEHQGDSAPASEAGEIESENAGNSEHSHEHFEQLKLPTSDEG